MRAVLRAIGRVKALAAIAAGCAALVAAPGAGAAPSAHSSVIGGHPVTVAEAPWLAAIAVNGPFGGGLCSGSVIAPRVVLTAGHCVREEEALNTLFPAKGFRVVTGVTDLSDHGSRVVSRVRRPVIYPSFEIAREETDLGLLILEKPVATPLLPIATAADAGLTAAGTEVTITGWGLTDPENEDPPRIAQAGALELQSPEFCQAHAAHGVPPFRIPIYAPGRQLCAIDKPDRRTTGCFGDSGGPVTARRADGTPVEVGVVSSGSPFCGFDVPNSYTRVDTISDWILGWVAAAETGAPPPPTPEPSPPFVYLDQATRVDKEALQVTFRRHFHRGTRKLVHCHRRAWEEVACRNIWHEGGSRYSGSTVVRFEVERGQAILVARQKTNWVDEKCDGRTDVPGCEVHIRHRTFRHRAF